MYIHIIYIYVCIYIYTNIYIYIQGAGSLGMTFGAPLTTHCEDTLPDDALPLDDALPPDDAL